MTGETFTLRQLADAVAGGNLTAMVKMLNDAGDGPHLDENEPDPAAVITRDQVITLWVDRAGSTVGHRLTRLLGSHPMRR
jgi:hypothetical protein